MGTSPEQLNLAPEGVGRFLCSLPGGSASKAEKVLGRMKPVKTAELSNGSADDGS